MAFGFISIRESVAEVASVNFWRDVIVEALCTFFLLALGTLARSPLDYVVDRPFLAEALVGGLYVYVIIESFGHIQGAAMNPVVAILFVATKRTSFIKGIMYVIAELAGATCGNMFVILVLPEGAREKFNAFHPGPGISVYQACCVEFVLTLGLSFVLLGALDGDHPRKTVSSPGLPIAISVAMGIIAGAPFSGGCMNPAISFAWAVLTRDWIHQWVYWSADNFAAVVAALLYFGFTVSKKPTISEIEEAGVNDAKEISNMYKEEKRKSSTMYPPLMKGDNGFIVQSQHDGTGTCSAI